MLGGELFGALASWSGQEMELVMCSDSGPARQQIKTGLSLTGWPPHSSIRKEAGSLKVSSISSSCYKVSELQRDGGTHTRKETIGGWGEGSGV